MECPRCGNDSLKSKTRRYGEGTPVTIRKCIICEYREIK